MRPAIARLIYCMGLSVLAGCAALPKLSAQESPPATLVVMGPDLPRQIARVEHERLDAAVRFNAHHPLAVYAGQAEARLRRAFPEADTATGRRQLIDAFTDELADAMHARSELAALYAPSSPDVRHADGVVLALTSAINLEVRRRNLLRNS